MMLLKTKINIGLFCYFTALLLIPSYPTPYSFFVDTVGSVFSLISIKFIFTFYYATVPEMNRTCIQGLSRLMLVCLSLGIIRRYFISLMVNVFHDFTQTFITDYPYLSCSLINTRAINGPFLLALNMLLLSRLGLLLFTMRFQSLNHERIVQACTVITFGIPLVDLILSTTLSHFSYCNTIMMSRFIKVHNFNVTIGTSYKDQLFGKYVPKIEFAALVAEITFQVVTYYKEHKVNLVNTERNHLEDIQTVLESCGEGTVKWVPSISRQVTSLARLPPPLYPGTQATTNGRRSSYPMEVRKIKICKRSSFVSVNEVYPQRVFETSIKRLRLNCWTKTSLPLERNEPQQISRIRNETMPIQKQRSSTITLVLLCLAYIGVTYLTTFVNPYTLIIEPFANYVLTFYLRFILYCLPIYWICRSEYITAYAFSKSKLVIVRILSFSFWPTSIQNLSNFLN